MNETDDSKDHNGDETDEMSVWVLLERRDGDKDLSPNLQAVGSAVEYRDEEDGVNGIRKKTISKLVKYSTRQIVSMMRISIAFIVRRHLVDLSKTSISTFDHVNQEGIEKRLT